MKLHRILLQYRVLAVSITVTFIYLALDMWAFYKENHTELETAGAGAFSALSLAIIGGLKFALDNISKRHEKDEHDDD